MVCHLVEGEALVVQMRRQRVERRGEVAVDPVFFDTDKGHGFCPFAVVVFKRRGAERQRAGARYGSRGGGKVPGPHHCYPVSCWGSPQCGRAKPPRLAGTRTVVDAQTRAHRSPRLGARVVGHWKANRQV
jgi:hypothetical protein